MADNSETFFRRLNRLFRSGPSIRRKIKGQNYKNNRDNKLIQQSYGSGPFPFKRDNSAFNTFGQFGLLDRMARYSEYSQMEFSPEIATTLNLYADEASSGDDKGKCFHVLSDNAEIKNELEELFYDVANIEFNLRPWVRNAVKYGDLFLHHEVVPDVGVVNIVPIPVSEMDREEGYDPDDPYSVRFKWIGRGTKTLENWQVSHIRLLGNDVFYPFGSSILEPARRIYNQLILCEDAMLTYRVVRSPERRVFYIDVANVAPAEIPNYMEQVKTSMRSNQVMSRTDGRGDYRHDPMNLLEDYFIPVRGTQTGTKIDTLAGGQHVSAVEDVEYLQKKLTSALGVPRAYIGWEESLSSKATLSQLDIRFSRTINIIQKTVIAEFNKLAILHLYAKGFEGEDLLNFELRMSNPSTVAAQQKLQLWKTKFEIAEQAKSGDEGERLVSSEFIRKEILGFNGDEIKELDRGIERDKLKSLALEGMVLPTNAEQTTKTDPFAKNLSQTVATNPATNNEPSSLNKISFNQNDDEDDDKLKNDDEKPVKASPYIQKLNRRNNRKITSGAAATATPNIEKMLNPSKNQSLKDIYDMEFLKNPLNEEEELKVLSIKPSLTSEMIATLKRFDNQNPRKVDILTEALDLEMKKPVKNEKDEPDLEEVFKNLESEDDNE